MSYKLIDGRLLARGLRAEIRARVGVLRELGWNQRLVSIAVGGIEATALYVRNQQRACAQVGIEFEDRAYGADVTQQELRAAISALNVDPRVTGIILQRPLPMHLDLKFLQNSIHPDKDVEGMHAANIGNIVYGGSALGPCTARASVALLKSTGLDLRGLEVVVVGHSEIVGKPIALQLMEEFATVTICHHETRNLAIHTRRAEALFVAVGRPGLITGDMVKPGAAVIDIGINQVADRIVGDVDFDSVVDVAGWITPVPGGVGPMTVAILLSNTVQAVERQRKSYEEAMASGGPSWA
ncbi:MAG: bifunctional 5,10-methylenetetrahydrofolate dehydrogenase/5,10-methenyltetrahydrofolate cyclohydrolase [Chloroflexi bacterium]|nr:bifunctional 5,10-methylenetetrahydrofolate dehydrogenase/5,10-methenyltetrahydrofolate cyclohydrolase [Chloroflexota bacterium]